MWLRRRWSRKGAERRRRKAEREQERQRERKRQRKNEIGRGRAHGQEVLGRRGEKDWHG